MWLIKKKRKNNKGFTLIELMAAASILGLIGLAILTTFAAGLHVYERVQSYGGVQADALLSLEEMEKNLRNAFYHSVIKFEGDAQSIAFPALIETIKTIDDEEERAISSIGQVLYYLDETDDETSVLVGEQRDYSQVVAEVETEEGQGNTLAFIDNVEFSYYSFDEEGEEYGWKDSWDAENESFPIGVRIELTFQNAGRDVQLVRTVFIPVGARYVASIQGEEGDDEENDNEGEDDEGEGL